MSSSTIEGSRRACGQLSLAPLDQAVDEVGRPVGGGVADVRGRRGGSPPRCGARGPSGAAARTASPPGTRGLRRVQVGVAGPASPRSAGPTEVIASSTRAGQVVAADGLLDVARPAPRCRRRTCCAGSPGRRREHAAEGVGVARQVGDDVRPASSRAAPRAAGATRRRGLSVPQIACRGDHRLVESEGGPWRVHAAHPSGATSACSTRYHDERVFERTDRGGTVADQLVIRGAREHNLKDVSLDLPRDSLIVFTGPVRLGQVQPRLRHDLRRGPAPLRRVALGVRAPVPRPDGQARRRLHRGPLARRSRSTRSPPRRTRARPSARSPRSTTTSGCSTPAPAARTARPAARRSSGRRRSRSSTGCCTLEEGTRFQVLAPVIRGRKGEYVDLFRQLQTQGFSRARVDGETHPLDRAAQARQAEEAHDRGGRRPARGQAVLQAPAHRLGRDRARPRRRPGGLRLRRPAPPRTRSAS